MHCRGLLRVVERATKPYRKSWWRRGLNALVRPLARLGLTGPRTHLLTVPGRRTGKPWSTPVSIVEDDGERWLVAPVRRPELGEERTRGGLGRAPHAVAGEQRLAVEELSPTDAVPVLKRYYQLGRVTRPFFECSLGSSDEEWLVEAPRHPVFHLSEESVRCRALENARPPEGGR